MRTCTCTVKTVCDLDDAAFKAWLAVDLLASPAAQESAWLSSLNLEQQKIDHSLPVYGYKGANTELPKMLNSCWCLAACYMYSLVQVHVSL